MQGPLLDLRRRYSDLCVSLGGATPKVTREYFLAGAPPSDADGRGASGDGRGAGDGGGRDSGGGGVGGGSADAAIPLLQWQLLDSLGGHTIDLRGGGLGRGKGGDGKGGCGQEQEGKDTGNSGSGSSGGDGDGDGDGDGGVVPALTVASLTSLLASPALLELFLNSGGVRPCKHGGCEDREAQARRWKRERERRRN